MYAFIDLKTRMFITKEPDEKDAVKQRASLERQLVRVHERNTDSIISIVHMDDKTDETDWLSPVIIGPKGGAAVIAGPTEAKAPSVDLAEGVKELNKEHRRKLNDLQNKFTSDCAALYNDHEKALLALLRNKPAKAKPAEVTTAGYDRAANWLDAGPLPKGYKVKP
jgi:hypothetical protein